MNETIRIDMRYRELHDDSLWVVPYLIALTLVVIFSSSSLLIAVAGDADRGLSSILNSDMVRGSSKYLQYMTWYGTFTNMAISFICIICLGQCILTFLATIGYYTAPNYWDMVDSIKTSGSTGGSAMGIGNSGGGRGAGGGFANTSGIDSLVDALNSMNINLKRYSDCSTQYESNLNINEYTTGWEYMVVKGPITLCMILFLNMGWKGTLQRMIAAVVDALTVYAEALPYEKMIQWAEFKAAQETGYTFTLGMAGDPEGKVKEALARKIFSNVQSLAHLTDEDAIQKLGTACENVVTSIEDKFVIPEHLGGNNAANADELKKTIWTQLSFAVRLTTTTQTQDVIQGVYIKVNELSPPGEHSVKTELYDTYYVVVALKYTEHAEQGVFTPKYYNEPGSTEASTAVQIISP